MAAEKVARFGVVRELGFLYYVKGSSLYKVPRAERGTSPAPIWVADVPGVMDPRFSYFLDRQGDVSRVRRAGDEEGDENAVEPPQTFGVEEANPLASVGSVTPPGGVEKVARLGLEREERTFYYLSEGALWAIPRKQPGIPLGPSRKIADTHLVMEEGYVYFLDRDGDLARKKR